MLVVTCEVSKVSNKYIRKCQNHARRNMRNSDSLVTHNETKNQRSWLITLVIDETYVFERFKKIAIRNVMISKQIYDEKISLSSLWFLKMISNFLIVSLRKRLTIFYEDDEHWEDKRL